MLVAGLEAEAVVARQVAPVVGVVEERHAEEARDDAPRRHVVAGADARPPRRDAPVEMAGLVRAGRERRVLDLVDLVRPRGGEERAVGREDAERARVEVDVVRASAALLEVGREAVALPERAVVAPHEHDVALRLRVARVGVVADAVRAQLVAAVADGGVAGERGPAVEVVLRLVGLDPRLVRGGVEGGLGAAQRVREAGAPLAGPRHGRGRPGGGGEGEEGGEEKKGCGVSVHGGNPTTGARPSASPRARPSPPENGAEETGEF